MDLLLCLIFAASGAAALIFEALWFRQASLVLGNSVWATGLTTSAFMAGLAAGNAVCARYGHRVRRPLEVYALLEGMVAVLGLAVVVGLPALSPALAGIARPLLDHPTALNAVRLGVAFLVLSTPAAAMGATLPLLVETLGGTEAGFGRALGRLYASNTLGAVGGALVGEMFLVPRLGLRGTGLVAASLDVAAALVVLALRRRLDTAPARAGGAGPFGRLWPAGARLTLVAAGLAGATLLALEAIWFRFLLLFVCGTAVAFASMLAVVLAGISGGAFLASVWLARVPSAVRHAPAVALAAGLAVVLGYVPFPLDAPQDPSCGLRVVPLAAAVAFPVSALSGALFTLLGATVRPKVSSAVAATGAITLANTVGALAGGFAGAFVLLPVLGIEKSVFAGALAYVAVAALAATALGRERARVSTLVTAGALALLLVLFPFGLMERRILPRVHARWTDGGSQVVALREGLTETSVWLTDRAWGQPVAHRLVTNGFSMAATGHNVDRYTRLFVYWPIALRPQARRALLISYGVGSTASALVGTRTLEAIDVVDISRDVLILNRAALPAAGHPLADPRVRVRVEDGRQHLLVREDGYDLITAEPPPPRNAGIVSLYTREFFELVRRRLVDGGIATYWLPVHSLQPAEARSVLGAFCRVFPDCTLWSGYGLDWMMAGTKDLGTAPTVEEFTAQWRDGARSAELARLGFDRPETLGTTFLGDAEDLRAYAQGHPVLTDDRPGILGPRDPAGFAPEFLALMDAGAARDRFRRSSWVRRVWPAQLRDRTAAAFAEQDLVNRLSTLGAGALRFDEIAAWTVGAARRFHILWLAGINDDVAEAAARAEADGVDEPRVHQALGAVALAEGRPAEAATRFEQALAGSQGPTRIVLWRALAQCLARQPEQAARGLQDATARIPREDASSVPVIASCRFGGGSGP